jgi:hypothetical protein
MYINNISYRLLTLVAELEGSTPLVPKPVSENNPEPVPSNSQPRNFHKCGNIWQQNPKVQRR